MFYKRTKKNIINIKKLDNESYFTILYSNRITEYSNIIELRWNNSEYVRKRFNKRNDFIYENI